MVCAGVVSGCSYHPLYGTGANAARAGVNLSRVDINTIADRPGQMLRNELIDRFYASGYPTETDYRLDIELTTNTESLTYRANASTERYGINTSAKFKLIEKKTGKKILSSVSSFDTSITALQEQYGNLTAVESALSQSIGQIADDITLRVATELGRPSKN